MLSPARTAVHLLLLSTDVHRRVGVPLCCDDNADLLRKKNEVDLGDAGEEGARALDDLGSAMAKRLEAMGAAKEAPPPAAPRPRGAFAVSDASASSDAAAAALYRMRRRQTGELEAEHAEQIERSIKMAQQWIDAGIPARARAVLEEIEKYMTFTSEEGAGFHLLLASVAVAEKQPARARRLWQKVAAEAKSSSRRWQAEQLLARSSGGAPPSSPSKPAELGSLFQMPNSWDD